MPNTFLGYPFDPEIFLLNWQAAQDPVLTALLDSGAVQTNSEIARLIANGSNQYTIPFYNVLDGEDDNYDGTTNMLVTEPTGGSQTGVVYGRMHAWKDRDFIRDFNSGANPMAQISGQVSQYWNKKRQNRLIGVLNGVFGITDNAGWSNHVLDIASKTTTASDANKLDAASAADAMQKAVGDNASIFSLAVMHSAVATNLSKLQLLNYRKYTDAAGIERTIGIADWNGLTVIVDDGAPAVASGSATGEMEYTTYLLGNGAIQYAKAPVDTPVETSRVVLEQGGYNLLATRLRETLHPNGFSFILPENTVSPTDAQLAAKANWKVAVDPKTIAMAKIVSNG